MPVLDFTLENSEIKTHFHINILYSPIRITGESATGKTYLYEALKKFMGLRKAGRIDPALSYEINEGYVWYIDYSFSRIDYPTLMQRENTIIFVDNADYLLKQYKSLRDHIQVDRKNYYVLLGRSNHGLTIPTQYIYEISESTTTEIDTTQNRPRILKEITLKSLGE